MDCDVAILGCGPVGATLANQLGAAGLDVVVIERDAQVFPLPLAVDQHAHCLAPSADGDEGAARPRARSVQ
jgi:2-polyprenyl-6-methoxyphenol hydroxylase-like FAD-dependent oxidoreductase